MSVRVELGSYTLVGREVEFLEVVQAVGDHARCTLGFDRDPRAAAPIAALRTADLADATVRVTFFDAAGADPSSGCLAFTGRVRAAEVMHGPSGAGRFTVVAVSPSYELAEHAVQRYLPRQGVAEVAQALGVRVAGPLPAGTPWNYVQPGASAWAFMARLAALEGLQLRAVWGRSPNDAPPAQPAEIGKGFASVTHPLTWGRDLLGLTTTLRPTNPGVTGAFYEVATKHDHLFQGVRAPAPWLGGAQPLVAAAERVANTDAGGGDPAHVVAGLRASTLAEFRTRLERVSARRLGSAVAVAGQSVQPSLRAGDQIDVGTAPPDAGGLAALASSWGGAGDDSERTGLFGLVSVVHQWNGTLYGNAFEATPWAEYHPAPAQAVASAGAQTAGAGTGLGDDHAGGGPGGIATHGATHGMTLGIVVENADPESQGRVRVRYTWMGESEQTTWLRVSAPVAGNGRGLGALPSIGDEVVLATMDGDPERPVVLGSLWNGVDKAVHAPGRQSWVTPAGNTLVFVEGKPGEEKERVELYSREGKCWVQLAAKGPQGKPLITVHSEGDLSLEAPHGQLRLSAQSMLTHVHGDAEREVQGAVLEHVAGKWAMRAGGSIGMASDAAVHITADADMVAHAKGRHTIVGSPIRENPPLSAVPSIHPTIPHAPNSVWKVTPVPAPGPGRHTADPVTPRAQAQSAQPAAVTSGAGGAATGGAPAPAPALAPASAAPSGSSTPAAPPASAAPSAFAAPGAGSPGAAVSAAGVASHAPSLLGAAGGLAGEVQAVVGAVQAPGAAALSLATAAGASALGVPAGVAGALASAVAPGARPAATAVAGAAPGMPAAATPVAPPNDAAGERAEVTRLSNAGDVEGARAILAPYVRAGDLQAVLDRLDVSSPRDGAKFWSGAKTEAQRRAGTTGVALETTAGGRIVDGWQLVNDTWPWPPKSDADDFWGNVSKNYSEGVSGHVEIIQSAAKRAPTGEPEWNSGGPTFKRWEWPVLERKLETGDVTGVKFLRAEDIS